MRNTKFIARGLIFAFLLNALGISPLAQAQDFALPVPGTMVSLSPSFAPSMLKGIKVHPDNPFRFEFILDKGDSQLGNDQLKDESTKLVKYFLASLTIPEKDLWVNLSPYEKNRIVPESFGQTEMGRDLLAEDYMLKQITASLIYPEGEIGKKFWKRVYTEAAKKFGTTNIPVNTFNKVWILPEKAVVYENSKAGTAYVVESRLKVMLEQDYLSLQKHEGIQSGPAQAKDTNQLGSQIVREVVIPELTKEVNEDKNFSQLRQVYNSLILATWYKKKIKDSILEQVYADKNKVDGVNIDDPQEKQRIYERYLQAFKKGAYNYIKEEIDPVTQQTMPRKYFSGGEELIRVNAAMSFTTRMPSDSVVDKAILSVDLFDADPSMMIDEIRKQIFGKGVDDWLNRYSKNGNKALMEDTIESLLKEPEFVDILRRIDKDDIPREIIKYAVRENINLQTKSLSLFLNALKKAATDVGLNKKVPTFSMPIYVYVQLITALADSRVQEYLDNELMQKPPNERLRALVGKIRELKLPLDSDNGGQIYSGLPDRLSTNVKKSDIQKIELPLAVDAQLQAALADSRVQEYLDNELMQKPPNERLRALVGKIRELKLPLDSDNGGHIYSGLPDRLSTNVKKSDIQKIELPLAVDAQLQAALADSRVQEYLDNELMQKPPNERLRALVGKIRELKLPLDSDNGGHIYSGLPDRLSTNVKKSDIQKIELPLAVDAQLQAALADSRVQEYLDNELMQKPPNERLRALVGKIRELKLPLDSDNGGQIYSGLPDRLSTNVKKSDIQKIELPLAVDAQLQAALADSRVQEYLDNELMQKPPNERLRALVGKIRELKLPLDSDNGGQIYSGLPDRLSTNVKKSDIQLVALPLAVDAQLQAALADSRVQEYLDNELMQKPPNERLRALVGKIRELKLPLDSDNGGQIYSGLPDRLSTNVKKSDIQLVALPLAVDAQLQAALADSRVQEYLDNELMQKPPNERLRALVGKIRELKLPLDSDNGGHIYSGLPDRLSTNVKKSDIQKIELPLAVDAQLQAALADSRVQEYLDNELMQKPPNERLRALVGKIRELKLPLDSDNGGQIYSGLPDRLSTNVKKSDIQKIELPLAVDAQLQAALADSRVQEYLDNELMQKPPNERLRALVGKIRELKLPLDSDNGGQIYSGLPDRLSTNVKKSDIQLVALPLAVDAQLQAALADSRVQEYLDNELMQKPPNERLRALVGKIRELKLPLDSDNGGQIYSGLPDRLSTNVKKSDIQLVALPLAVDAQLQAALADSRVQEYLDNELMQKPPNERLRALVGKIRELKLPLDSDNGGHIYSGLPDRLSTNVKKSDIQKIELPLAVDAQLQAALADSRVQEYLDNELMQKPPNERLRALVGKIRELKLPLDSDNGGQIYSGLPDRLSTNVKKSDIQLVALPLAVDAQLQAALADSRVQEYLDNELMQKPPNERLRALVGKIRELKLPLDSDSYTGIYTGLPSNLRNKFPSVSIANAAMLVDRKGGIDLTQVNMNLQTQNGEIIFHINPAMLSQFQNTPGFVPVVINVQRLDNLQQFLTSGDNNPTLLK